MSTRSSCRTPAAAPAGLSTPMRRCIALVVHRWFEVTSPMGNGGWLPHIGHGPSFPRRVLSRPSDANLPSPLPIPQSPFPRERGGGRSNERGAGSHPAKMGVLPNARRGDFWSWFPHPGSQGRRRPQLDRPSGFDRRRCRSAAPCAPLTARSGVRSGPDRKPMGFRSKGLIRMQLFRKVLHTFRAHACARRWVRDLPTARMRPRTGRRHSPLRFRDASRARPFTERDATRIRAPRTPAHN